MKKLLVLAVTLVAAAGISVAIATASPSTSRGGDLHVTKACGDIPPGNILFCTITGSNLKLIKAGSRVIYFQDPGANTLDSDIALVVGPGSYALGHVVLDLGTGQGVVTLSGGAGPFASFHAKVRVTPPGYGDNGADWAWDGWYSFGGHD